jgi:hypothetical protein
MMKHAAFLAATKPIDSESVIFNFFLDLEVADNRPAAVARRDHHSHLVELSKCGTMARDPERQRR